MDTLPRSGLPPLRSDPQPFGVEAPGARLSGQLYRAEAPVAAAVIHGATAVPQGYYRGFAEWLAQRGITALTYDYRGFGASACGPLRAERASMADWAFRDAPAAQQALAEAMPGVPLWVIGHSLGGLGVAHHPGAVRIARVIAVASGLPRLRDQPWPYRAVSAAFWHGLGPLASAGLGYLPGRRLGLGADLPTSVFRQWKRWCLHPASFRAEAEAHGPDLYEGPAKLVAIVDDVMVPPATVWRHMQHYPQARKRQLVLHPKDFGLPGIGHMGVFRRANAALWPALIA